MTNKNPLTLWSSVLDFKKRGSLKGIGKDLNRIRKSPWRGFVKKRFPPRDGRCIMPCFKTTENREEPSRRVSAGRPVTTDLFSGSSPSSGSTVAAWGSRGGRVCGPQPAPEAPAPPSSADPSSSPPHASPPVPPARPAWPATRPVGTLGGRKVSFNFLSGPKKPKTNSDSLKGLCLAPALVSTWSRGELWVRAATSRGTRPCSLTRFTPFSLSLSHSLSFFSLRSHTLPPPPPLVCSLESRLCTAKVSSFSTASHKVLYWRRVQKKRAGV